MSFALVRFTTKSLIFPWKSSIRKCLAGREIRFDGIFGSRGL